MPPPSPPRTPNSSAEWVSLARQHEQAARLLCEDKVAAARAWDHAGFAIEAMLKGVIMRQLGLNRWPDRQDRPDLHVHSLRKLAVIAGIAVGHTDPIAPAWKTVLDWDRGHSYVIKPMPRKIARELVEAAFGEDGVLLWLKRSFLPNV